MIDLYCYVFMELKVNYHVAGSTSYIKRIQTVKHRLPIEIISSPIEFSKSLRFYLDLIYITFKI